MLDSISTPLRNTLRGVGCFAQGENIEDVIADAREAISSHLEALRESGDPVPPPSSVVLATVSVPAA